MSMGSSNFMQGSVNKGPFNTKIPSSKKILRNLSGYLIVKDNSQKDASALKDVMSD